MCESSRKSGEAKSALKAEDARNALRMRPEKNEKEEKDSVEKSEVCCEPVCPDACG